MLWLWQGTKGVAGRELPRQIASSSGAAETPSREVPCSDLFFSFFFSFFFGRPRRHDQKLQFFF